MKSETCKVCRHRAGVGCWREAGDEEKLKVSNCGVRGVRGAGVGRDLRPDQPLSSNQQFRGHTRHVAKVLRYCWNSSEFDTSIKIILKCNFKLEEEGFSI